MRSYVRSSVGPIASHLLSLVLRYTGLCGARVRREPFMCAPMRCSRRSCSFDPMNRCSRRPRRSRIRTCARWMRFTSRRPSRSEMIRTLSLLTTPGLLWLPTGCDFRCCIPEWIGSPELHPEVVLPSAYCVTFKTKGSPGLLAEVLHDRFRLETLLQSLEQGQEPLGCFVPANHLGEHTVFRVGEHLPLVRSVG